MTITTANTTPSLRNHHAGGGLRANAGLVLETQAWPDSPNRLEFPPCILQPGERYKTETHYRFERS